MVGAFSTSDKNLAHTNGFSIPGFLTDPLGGTSNRTTAPNSSSKLHANSAASQHPLRYSLAGKPETEGKETHSRSTDSSCWRSLRIAPIKRLRETLRPKSSSNSSSLFLGVLNSLPSSSSISVMSWTSLSSAPPCTKADPRSPWIILSVVSCAVFTKSKLIAWTPPSAKPANNKFMDLDRYKLSIRPRARILRIRESVLEHQISTSPAISPDAKQLPHPTKESKGALWPYKVALHTKFLLQSQTRIEQSMEPETRYMACSPTWPRSRPD
mmetsp:Transcript_14907/g.25867  ORF Transcript_14907/g.25867 Transcript_14907/m.25867 type:complete len:269 (+) Transcript_14907:629-1435(+)